MHHSRERSIHHLVAHLLDWIPACNLAGGTRHIVAIAGAPGSGKSSLAEALFACLEARRPGKSAIMPMDGYHMDNAVLSQRGWLPRKGAPHTFDVDALERDLHRVRSKDRSVLLPVFDRDLDLARASAREIGVEIELLILEGNYLLLDQAPWSQLRLFFDTTVFLEVEEPVLEQRLIERWLRYGHDEVQARERALGNDIPNAKLVAQNSVAADITLKAG